MRQGSYTFTFLICKPFTSAKSLRFSIFNFCDMQALHISMRKSLTVAFFRRSLVAFNRYSSSTSVSSQVADAGPCSELALLTGADAGIGVLTLCRPRSRNVLSERALEDLHACLAAARATPPAALRVLVLRALGPVFCAGADLRERAALPASAVPAAVARIGAAINALAALPMPVVAAIDGPALGGGLELALAADVRVAGPAAELGLPETALSVIPGAGGTQRLPRLVGSARAKELIFTTRRLRVDEAVSWGLAISAGTSSEIAGGSDAPAFSAALALARTMLPQGPLALRAAKAAIDGGAALPLAQGLEVETRAYATVVHTKDRLEGLAAFAGKRRPVYKGE